MIIPQAQQLINELVFTTSRSSGPGGQNVNKVNTKVTLKLDIKNSIILNGNQKQILVEKIGSKLTKEGILIIAAQEKRSQLENKEEVMAKLNKLLTKVFTPRKPRKGTKPPKVSKQNRLQEKKQKAEKKQWRQKP